MEDIFLSLYLLRFAERVSPGKDGCRQIENLREMVRGRERDVGSRLGDMPSQRKQKSLTWAKLFLD
jgi:hypothetical protein